MARWRLLQPHYLNVPGTEWEYKEVDRTSGRQVRKVFAVPLYLDPREPADQNHSGEVIVGQGNGTMPRDYIFLGEPTPDMEPMDADAQAVTDACKHKWVHPVESLPGQAYSASLIAGFEKQISDAMVGAAAKAASPVSAGGIDPKKFAELQEQVAELTAALAAKSGEPKALRRA